MRLAPGTRLGPYQILGPRALGYLLGNLGRLPEAIAAARRATELDPLSPPAWRILGEMLMYDGQLAAARQAFQRAMEVGMREERARSFLGTVSLLEGKPEDALIDFERADEAFRLTGTAMARYSLGQQAESQQALAELVAKYSHNAAWQIAEVHAWRGERDLAFEWLDRAYAQRDSGLPLLKVAPTLVELRDDPRYAALLEKMNLPA